MAQYNDLNTLFKLIKRIKTDPVLYFLCQPNIAKEFKDMLKVNHINIDETGLVEIHKAANKASKNFLNILINNLQKRKERYGKHSKENSRS